MTEAEIVDLIKANLSVRVNVDDSRVKVSLFWGNSTMSSEEVSSDFDYLHNSEPDSRR